MLLIGAVLLGAFIWFVERESENTIQKEVRGRSLFAAYPESIFRLEMERGDVRIVCSKKSGKWRLTEPTDAPLDPAIVEQMIAAMVAVQRGELITQQTLNERGLTPTDYGFDEPQATIRFSNNHGTSTWILGRDAPIGDTLYVMSGESGDIISAPRTLLHLVPEDPSWIRDRTLFHDNAASIRGIDLRTETGFLQLRKDDAAGWEMVQPHAGPADARQVGQLIEAILSARINTFVTDEQTDLTVYGLSPAEVEVTLFNRNEETQSLLVGSALPDTPELRYAKWVEGASVFAIPSEWVEKLYVDRNLLRSRKIVTLSQDQLIGMTIEKGDLRIELAETNNQWVVVRPVRQDVAPRAFERVSNALFSGVASDFVNTPTEEQRARLEEEAWAVTAESENHSQTIRLLREESGNWLVCRGKESALCEVADSFFNESFIDPLYYRDLTVLTIEPGQIRKIVQNKSSEQEQVLDDPSDLTFQRVANKLGNMKALRYVSGNTSALEQYGLDAPAFRLTVLLTGTNLLGRALAIGSETDDGYFAMLQGENAVFVLPDEVVETLIEMPDPSSENTAKETGQ